MKTNIMNRVSRKANMLGLKIKKHSPEILVAAGVVGVVASGVMACKATTKLNTILDESKEQIDKIHEVTEHPELLPDNAIYTKEDSQKDLTIVYAQTGFKLVKLYAPSVILGATSIGAIIWSHKIMTKRNAALAAAYAVVDKGFKDYRNRVVERFGKNVDRELRYNIKAQEIEETVVDEKGKEKTIKTTVGVVNPNDLSEFAKFWGPGNMGYTKDPEANMVFLRQRQNYANDQLQTKGYLFLNDVYEMLGIPKTKAGQIVGWLYNEECPNGDNFVDFGLYDGSKEAVRRFVDGSETVILLDFNCDGPILNEFWKMGCDSFGSGNI